jgi:Tol biopolymer transport system component
VSDWLRENATVSKVTSKKIAVFISLWLISFFFLSCGGSGGGGAGGSETANFPPVVFLADKDRDRAVKLYASFDDGTDIIKLSNDLVTSGNVVDFKVSPNGILVAYIADQDTNEKFELYVVPVDKSASENARKISGFPMVGDGIKKINDREYAFAWAPNNSRIAYLADQNTDGVIELFSNTPDGTSSSTIRLSGSLASSGNVEEFAWAPDSQRIAYRANQTPSPGIHLFTTFPNRSTTFTQISSGLTNSQMVSAFKWSPDSSRIAFTSDRSATGFFRLFSNFPTGGPQVEISGSDVKSFQWSPDSFRLAFVLEPVADAFELYTTLSDRLPSTLISIDLEDGDEIDYGWSADSSLIAFIADADTVDVFELYTYDPVTGSPTTKVSGDLLSEDLLSEGDVTAFKWAPTELLIAYVADQDFDDKFELFTTNPPPRITVIKVSKPFFAGLAVEGDFKWSVDSSLIAYRADQDTPSKIELYTTDPDGLINDRVSGTLPSSGDVDEFKWEDLGSAIGYLANQISVNVPELFASLPNGGGNTRLSSDLVDENGDLEPDGDVSAFEWVP